MGDETTHIDTTTRREPNTDPLTERELDVLHLLAEGYTNREIGEQLFISVGTVKWHNNQIFSKLGVSSRDEAVSRARTLGLIEKDATPRCDTNLPSQTTRFIGRKSELAELTRLITSPDHLQITILAPGGMGKTRLALAVAEGLLTKLRDGVYYVPLAPLANPEHIVSAIAVRMGYQFQTGDRAPWQQVLDYLSGKHLLLVLDNYEHLLAGASLVTDMLAAAPQVMILVTSRERLQLRGETVYSLRGLEMPDDGLVRRALTCDAVQLFSQAAQRVVPEFKVDETSLPAVAEICRLVDGMPLGLELAAGWVDVLSLDEIAEEITHSLDFLYTEMRDMPERLRSIRAVFEATWTRLTDLERDAFIKLAVFRGGCSRKAVQAITGADLRTLTALVNKALLRLNSEGRYETHELLRQYAEEQLECSGKAATVRDAHSTYYGDAVHQLLPDRRLSGKHEALDDIEVDLENIRAGWEWAVGRGQHTIVDQYINGLYLFFERRGRHQEGEEFFGIATSRMAEEDAEQRVVLGRALARQGILISRTWKRSREEEAETLLRKSLSIAREREDVYEIDRILFNLMSLARRNPEPDQNLMEMARERITLLRKIDAPHELLADALSTVGLFTRGFTQAEEGQQMTLEGLALYRKIGGKYGEAIALVHLGCFAAEFGQCQQALDYFRESIMLCREIGAQARLARRLAWAAEMNTLLGDFNSSQADVEEAYTIAKAGNHQWAHVVTLTQLGIHACLLDEDYTRGQQLCEESISIGSGFGYDACLNTWGMALACCGSSNWPIARQHCQTGLRLSHDLPFVPVMLGCLTVAACIVAHEGRSEQAVEWLALASSYPTDGTGWMQHWQMLSRVKADLEADLGAEVCAAAWERGKALDLVTVVEEILAKHGL